MHRLCRVQQQVEHCLLQVRGIKHSGKRTGRKVKPQSHALMLRLRAEKIGKFFDDAVEIRGPGVQTQLARIRQEVSEDAAKPFGLATQAVESAQQPLASVLGSGFILGKILDALGEQLRVEADGAERVLDFMGEAARHLPQFRETFGRAGPALGGELLGKDAPNLPAGDGGCERSTQNQTHSDICQGGPVGEGRGQCGCGVGHED